MALIDLTERRFGRWVVVSRDDNRHGQACWKCVCDCGNEKSVVGHTLRNGKSLSCGCLRGEQLASRLRLRLNGQRFGLWVVLGEADDGRSEASRWLCRCDCGTERIVLGTNLSKGTSASCGCEHADRQARSRAEALIGQRFGRLVVDRARVTGARDQWICVCDCGEAATVSGHNLLAGKTRSCGCLTRNRLDRTGQRYGKLVALQQGPPEPRRGAKTWVCQCDCGRLTTVTGDNLGGGSTRSCGCATRGEILDERHCLYRLYDDLGDLLYIGIAVNPARRFIEHQSRSAWWLEVARRELEWHPDRRSVEAAETLAIRNERPAFNVQKRAVVT